MKLIPVTNITSDEKALENEFKNARQVGPIRLGEKTFFFKSKLKQYYIPFEDIKRCYRRVLGVPTKMCCGKGEVLVENLVIGDGDTEYAVIQLPGTRAAKVLFEDLKGILPNADFSSPKRDKETGEIIKSADLAAEGAKA